MSPTPLYSRRSIWGTTALEESEANLDPWMPGMNHAGRDVLQEPCLAAPSLTSTQRSHLRQESWLVIFGCCLVSHLQNLFPGSSSLIFFIVDEECCHIFMPRLWAVEVCAVTVKILNLNLVNHNVCCPYGSALCSQFYFIKCYFLDSLSSRIILILHFRTKHANLLWFLASVIFFFSFGFEGFLSVKQEKILLTFL